MKCFLVKSLITATLMLLFLPAIGVCSSFKSMTTEELSRLRGTMYKVTQEERDAFRDEWKKRIDQMSPEEKQQYLGAGGGRGKGNRSDVGLGDGTGRGRGGGGSSAAAAGNSPGTGQGAGRGGGSSRSTQ